MAFVQVRALPAPVTGSFVREGLASPKQQQQRLGCEIYRKAIRQMTDSAILSDFLAVLSILPACQMSVATHTYLHDIHVYSIAIVSEIW